VSSIPSTHAAGHDDHHGHGEHAKYPFLAHHFETPAHQFDSAKLGMWLFLATEVLFFGALFVAYAVLRLRGRSPEVAARDLLEYRHEARLVPTYRKAVEDWLATGVKPIHQADLDAVR